MARPLTEAEADERFRAAGLTPLEPYVAASAKRRCRCDSCGAEVTPRLSQLKKAGGCRACGYEIVRRKLQEQKTDLDKIEAVYARAGVTPLEPWVNANTKRLVRCNTCGFEARIGYSGIYQGQGGCRRCGRAKITAKQLVPIEKVDAVFQAHGLQPIGPYEGTNTPRRAKCQTCGRTVAVRYNELRRGKRKGCRYCSYSAMGDAMRVPEEVADQVFLDAGVEPLEPYIGTQSPRLCRCMTCGKEVRPAHNSLKNGQGGCKYCAPVGLDRNAAGIIYLLRHEAFQALKIGVTTEAARTVRLDDHERHGWSVIQTWATNDGAEAEMVETAVLRWWRFDLGAPEALQQDDMPQSGHTETAALVFVAEDGTIEMVNRLLQELHTTGTIAARRCSIGDCDGEVKARELCGMHYSRWQRHGNPLFERLWEPTQCSEDGCERTSDARGMCLMHYKRWRRRNGMSA